MREVFRKKDSSLMFVRAQLLSIVIADYHVIIMMNCFCCMVDRRKAFSLISNRDHCQSSSPTGISDTPRAGFEPAQNLSSGFAEWSCAVLIITTLWHHLVNMKMVNMVNMVNMKMEQLDLWISLNEGLYTHLYWTSSSLTDAKWRLRNKTNISKDVV